MVGVCSSRDESSGVNSGANRWALLLPLRHATPRRKGRCRVGRPAPCVMGVNHASAIDTGWPGTFSSRAGPRAAPFQLKWLNHEGMARPADEFDILRPVFVEGSADLHLAPSWNEPPDATTVCGLQVERVATNEMFGQSDCLECASRAVEAAIPAVRHANGSIVNLERFVASRRPSR